MPKTYTGTPTCRARPMTDEEAAYHRQRFDSRWALDTTTGCWVWKRALEKSGYGMFWSPFADGRKAHRHGWVAYKGEIPAGMVIDHVCRTRACVNPDHMRLVTPGKNVTENSLSPAAQNKARTHCVHGHPFYGDNLRYDARGRICKTCAARKEKQRKPRRREFGFERINGKVRWHHEQEKRHA